MDSFNEQQRTKRAVALEIEQNREKIGVLVSRHPRLMRKPSKLARAASASMQAAAACQKGVSDGIAIADQKVRSNIYPGIGISLVLGAVAGCILRCCISQKK